MGCGRDTFRRNMRHRRGLSFVEFIGCMLALGSGLALGSVYLGVDMKTMFVGILERADLVDPGFFGTAAVAGQVAENSDVARSRVGGQSPSDASSEQPGREWADEERQAATQLYWQGLAACIRADVSHRRLDSRGDKKWRLFDYLSHRRKGHQEAVEAIESLDRGGVDQRLLGHGDQVLTWHQTGADVFGQAVQLLTNSPSNQLSGPLAEEWRSTATQHRMEERLVRERHTAVASYLDHAFQNVAPFKRGF